MKIEMKLKTDWHDKDIFLRELRKLEREGWIINGASGGRSEEGGEHAASLYKEI